MSQDMLRIIDAIARDRNVDKELLFNDIEQAMVSAARKHYDVEEVDVFTSKVDRLTGEIEIFREGEKIPIEALGRIPAQTAKQVMIQKFREDERASIFDEFQGRVGELIAGTALRYEGGALVVQLGRAEGYMPRAEQIQGEQHMAGERVRCLILDVRESGNQVKILLSRASPEFVRALFEVEVPEVTERVIEIKALSREPGQRSKVAVSSIDSKVDAVGACVGVRGSRIKNIVDELAGEKIDVVRWNESSQVLIANALRPAEIVEISLCFELGRATVVVNEDQLSLAIGKRGQNVRLAARLTGWDIDILTPPEFSKGLDVMEEAMRPLEAVTEAMIDRLAALGVISVFDVEELGVDVLMEHLKDMELPIELANRMVFYCSRRAKIVAEEQALEKAKGGKSAGKASSPESDAAAHIDSILGQGPAAPKEKAPSEQASGDIMEMLLDRPDASASSPSEATDVAEEAADDEAETVEVASDDTVATDEAEAATDEDSDSDETTSA